ncbi:MAG: hypothetical protein NE334_05750 [Lentisphaeraceae bacterium]|nr:hypothetical protein [Lentisphaeraceae bacterium]
MDDKKSKYKLIESIAFLLASGKISPKEALPALQKLNEHDFKLSDIQTILESQTSYEFQAIITSLQKSRLDDASKFYKQNKAKELDKNYFSKNLDGYPLELNCDWHAQDQINTIKDFCVLLQDFHFINKQLSHLPNISQLVEQRFKSFSKTHLKQAYLWAGFDPEKLIQLVWDSIDDDARKELREFKVELKELIRTQNEQDLVKVQSLPDELQVVDHDSYVHALNIYNPDSEESFVSFANLIFLWPSRDIIPIFKKLWQVEAHRERLSILLNMRFGNLKERQLSSWEDFFEEETIIHLKNQESIKPLSIQFSTALIYLWSLRFPGVSQGIINLFEKISYDTAENIAPEDFVERWSKDISEKERKLLLGLDEEVVPEKNIIESKEATKVITELQPEKIEQKKIEVPPEPSILLDKDNPEELQEVKVPEKIEPSVWDEHMKPFLSENWFMMAGVILFVVGSGIISYVTWDKHWLFRYTLMPALLAFFTAGLAYLGRWIHKKDDSFKTTATILRGAAIQLLPINFMAVALLSSDDSVSMKNVIVPIMSAIYLGCSWVALKRLCKAIYKPLENTLSRTILLLNTLVILVPIVSVLGYDNKQSLLLILGIGFYVGFTILAKSVIHFSKNILTRELATEKHVVWFYGLALVGTFLQVFGWVHSQIRHLPQTYTYAPMLILTAALLLMLERKAAILLKKNSTQEAESFIGYGMVILGVLMSTGNEYVRIICCILAGAVWYFQATQHRNKLHYYVSITFFITGIFSVGFLDVFPVDYISALGIVCVILLSLFVKYSRKKKQYELAKACVDTQVAVLLITVLTAILTQLQYNTPPYLTSIYMSFSAIMFIRRAYIDDQLKWLHTAMFIFALTLPYLGCVDLEQGTLEGNTLIFGISILSILWILAVKFIPFRLLKDARSSVLWFYGVLSVTAMIIRVVMERGAPLNPHWYLAFMDYSGPIAMAIILVLTTHYSRSLIPAFMASIIAIILFPELKANFRATFDMVGFGSGLGSASTSFTIIILSFFLRRHPKLEQLSEGDKFLNKFNFPFRRYDHTLFTWPLMLSACFLLVKTGTFNLVRQIVTQGISIKGAVALILIGLSSWMLCIYYRRQKGRFCFHPGWIYISLGLVLLFDLVSPQAHLAWPILVSLLILQALHLFSHLRKTQYSWLEELFEKRAANTLAVLSHIISWLCIVSMISNEDKKPLLLLMTFLCGQFIWHALARRNQSYGIHLYLLTLVCIITWPIDQASQLFESVIGMAGIVLFLHIFIERNKPLYRKIRPLSKPFLVLSTLSILAFGVLSFPLGFKHSVLNVYQILIIAGLLLVAARAHLSRFLVLWASSLLYSIANGQNVLEMLNPLHLAIWGLTLIILNEACSYLYSYKAKLVSGSQGISFLKSTQDHWLFCPAIFIILIAELLHITQEWRSLGQQVMTSYIAAAAFILISRKWRNELIFAGAISFLTLGNIHLIRVTCGQYLLDGGLSENHIISMGLGLSLLFVTAIKKASQNQSLNSRLSQAGLVMSLLVLVILVGNYLVHPNLETISLLRFTVSAIMSLMAALYFRSAARYPQPNEEQFSEICEGIYHFGVSMSFWCISLMIPFLRTPQTAMLAFGIPAVYLFIRAELGFRMNSKKFSTYRNSATIIFYILLALYIGRRFVHMIFYPEMSIDSSYYHNNAPLIFLYGVLLCRAHALGGTIQTAFFGGLAIVTGFFFTVTAVPSLSPFSHTIRACWVAILSGHFWILVNHRKSPIKTFLQQIAGLSDEQWQSLRFPWGNCLFTAVHIIFIISLGECSSKPLLLAPALLGVSTVTLHLCAVRRSPFLGILFRLELLAGIHAGFFVESYLKAENVVWVLLGIWVIILFTHLYLKDKIKSSTISTASCFLAALICCHVVYHHPNSTVGLASVVSMAILALFTPCSLKNKLSDEHLLGVLYLLLPTYLSYFIQYNGGHDFSAYTLPLPATVFTLFITGLALHFFKVNSRTNEISLPSFQERYITHLNNWLLKEEPLIYSIILWCVSAFAVFTLYSFSGVAFAPRDLGMMIIVTVGLSVSWYFHGVKKKDTASYIMMIISGILYFAVFRHQLVLTTDIWRNEYDVWSTLLFSLSIASSKSWIDRCERQLQIPVLTMLFLLPAAALSWSIYNNMGTDYTLAIIGTNSLIFTFLGKDNKTSSYNFVAIGGFVAFSMIALWSKLEIHSLHVYVLPTGMGVLILLQLFHDKINIEARHRIRLVTLIIMMATVGYYALIAEPRSIGFNITMLAISLLGMTFGGFLKIRLYLIVGFTGLLTNLTSIMTRQVISMDKGSRMAILGSLILLIGGALVFGNLYYKTHQESIRGFIDKWRKRFGVWE